MGAAGRACLAGWLGLGALAALVALKEAPAQASAHLIFAGEAERVYTIEKRPHLYSHELTLGGGVTPLNSFYLGLAPNLAYTYHFSDLWAWELAGGFYSFNVTTGLGGLIEQTGQQAVKGADYRLRSIVTTNAVVRPLYGKLALFNRRIVHAQVYFTAGAGMGLGVVVGESRSAPAANLGLGLVFWASDAIGLKLDIRDHYVFDKEYPGSVLMIMLAASFNFNVLKAPAWRPQREYL